MFRVVGGLVVGLVVVWRLRLVVGLVCGFIWWLSLRILRLDLLAGLMLVWILGTMCLLGSG